MRILRNNRERATPKFVSRNPLFSLRYVDFRLLPPPYPVIIGLINIVAHFREQQQKKTEKRKTLPSGFLPRKSERF